MSCIRFETVDHKRRGHLLPPSRRTRAGFTLIELMITVAVIGILAAIAYPAYQDQVRKSRRAGAQAVLLDVAQKEQQVFLDIRSYAAAANTVALADAPLRVGVATNVSSAYSFSVAVTTPANAPPQFVVSAAPQGAQAADPCGSMTVNQIGVRGAALSAGCW